MHFVQQAHASLLSQSQFGVYTFIIFFCVVLWESELVKERSTHLLSLTRSDSTMYFTEEYEAKDKACDCYYTFVRSAILIVIYHKPS